MHKSWSDYGITEDPEHLAIFVRPDPDQGEDSDLPLDEDEDGPVGIRIPAKFEVCSRCQGRGSHDPEAFSGGFSQEDFDEDPDFKESYLSGEYDVRCEECGGERVTLEPDRDHASPEALAIFDDILSEIYDAYRLDRMERSGQWYG
jgi:hypothetical protein